MSFFATGLMGTGIIGAILEYVMYIAVIAFCIRATKAVNIYIEKNENK